MSDSEGIRVNEIWNLLSALADNSAEREEMYPFVSHVIEEKTFPLEDQECASLHWWSEVGKKMKAAKEVYAELLMEEDNDLDVDSIPSDNMYSLKKLYTDFSHVEHIISKFIWYLTDTSALTSDYARTVLRDYVRILASDTSFYEAEVDEYPEERAWFVPQFGSRKTWLKLANAVNRRCLLDVSYLTQELINEYNKTFHPGDFVVYVKRDCDIKDGVEFGMVKSVRDRKCFVYYTSGDTAALTDNELLRHYKRSEHYDFVTNKQLMKPISEKPLN